MNYYLAADNCNTLSDSTVYDLPFIQERTQTHIPNTFEGSYIAFLSSPKSNRDYESLLQAYEIDPERPEIFSALIAYYLLLDDPQKVKLYCTKLHRSQIIPEGLFEWNYNALMSVDEEAILITQGENDTYPALILQNVLGIRPKVKVLKLDLLAYHKSYCQKLFFEEDIPPLGREVSFPFTTTDELYVFLQHIVAHSAKPVYLGVAISKQLRKRTAGELFLTGLAFRNTNEPFDNVSVIKSNYEERFRKDRLHKNLVFDPGQSVVDLMDMNYIPSLVLLHDRYLEESQLGKAENVKSLAFTIADRTARRNEIKSFFALKPKVPAFELEVKRWDKMMMPVAELENTYAAAVELTYEDYDQFLKDLLDRHEFERFRQYSPGPVDWKTLLPGGFGTLPDEELFEHGHPEDPEMPVVNITYEAAIAYCQWLTNAYNRSEDKNKKYRKVEFFIPSEEEWIIAARGGLNTAPYPWGGYYYKNAKGCFLINVNPYFSEYDSLSQQFVKGNFAESPGIDGAFYLAKADAYWPNNYGLFNLSGNAAEMVKEKDFTLGGSWLDPVHYAQIGIKHYRTVPSPAVGIRLFMKVLE